MVEAIGEDSCIVEASRVSFEEMETGQSGFIRSGAGCLCSLETIEGELPVFIGTSDITTSLTGKHARKFLLRDRNNNPIYCLQEFDVFTREYKPIFYIPTESVYISPQIFNSK